MLLLLKTRYVSQEIRLWSVDEGIMVGRFRGHVHSRFVVRACFGGDNDAFVASGSEGLLCRWYNSCALALSSKKFSNLSGVQRASHFG